MPVFRERQRWLAIVATAMLAGLVVTVPGSRAAGQPAPTPNPPISDSCGVDVTLVLDASGSIQSSGAVNQVRGAAEAFLDALRNTSSTARVTQFGTVSKQLAASTLVDDTSLGQGGALRGAINGYYNPIPPRVPPANFHQYNSGNPQSSGSFGGPNNSQNQYTNWDQALDQANDVRSELVVFVTDGDPTAYDFNQPGDPFNAGPPPDVAFRTDRDQAQPVTLARAVAEANVIKSANTRMLAVGVGEALGNAGSQARLVAVSGPQIVRNTDLGAIDSLNDVDVALVTNFEDLAQFLRGVVLQLCSPSLTIRKLAQSAGDADYLPAPGWSMTVTPSALPPGTGFSWILPDTTPAPSKTVVTDAGGFAQFQWEPVPPESVSQAIVQEALLPGYTPGRPGDNDFRCEFRDEDGVIRTVTGEVSATLTFTLNPIGQEIGTCTVWNSFNYLPAIDITKVNAPTTVRGDLTPPATVTSSYAVTNPGNTPLSNIVVTDDRCGPVVPLPGSPKPGDTNGDGRLDLTETWLFSCTRTAQISGSPEASPVVNTATVTGTDPNGTLVDDEATDDVEIFFPEITLTKLVNGEDAVIIPRGDGVTYTYAATNTGNTDLAGITLVDDTPPCTSPTRGPDTPPGNGDDVMDVGETWNWSCIADERLVDVINTATVSGTPSSPATGTPFPDPNPAVTAEADASVDVVNPDIELTKSVDPEVVLLDLDGTPEAVTYAFEAVNTGTPPQLNRPGATAPGPAKEPGWVVDARCLELAEYDSGDTDDDDLLDTGETWVFTCPGEVDEPTVNIASITAQPSDGNGVPLPGVGTVSDLAVAFVNVLTPDIDIVKTALVGVVLDADATPVAGPDFPDPRPATYLYEVTNTGNVALDLDPDPPVDDTCSPLELVDDANGDPLLDVDETWTYSCSTPLTREQGNTPPVTGDESALVQNEVSVTGVPQLDGDPVPDKSVSDSDIAQVQVIDPGISITKTVSAPIVLADDEVTYTYVVQNTGDVGLQVLGPVDDTCEPLVLVDDGNGDDILNGANSGVQESWTYECTSQIGLPGPDEAPTVINTVVVGGIDTLGNLYEADDTAEVRVFDPAISLTKTVSDSLVLTGSTVTYDFEVTNVGASPVAADDVLADITLVDLSAPSVPSCLVPTFVGGDTDGDGLLPREPAETWTYRCTAVITAPTTDVAIVRGTAGTLFQPPLPIDVFDIDAAFVQPFTPRIEITKTAAPTLLVGGGPVTYTYLVRNTGDVPLSNVTSRITDNTCAPLTYVSGDEDGDGLLDTPNSIFEDSGDETWTFTCTTTITVTTTNTVVVTGTPSDPGGVPLCTSGPAGESILQVPGPCDANDDATAIVTVVAPGTINIIKRTPAATTASFGFTFGTETFELQRDGTRTTTGVAPGSYTVTELAVTGWRLTSIVCTDATGDSVVTLADRQATIIVAPGETVTCEFTNEQTGLLPQTGSNDLRQMLSMAAMLAGLGALLLLFNRRHRIPA